MDLGYKNSIVRYYDNTRFDYRFFWFRKNSRSVHFGFYDEEVKSHSDSLVKLNKVLAKKGEIKKGDTILDAGCGQGGSSIWLAENYEVQVTGITLVPHQVEIAQKEANKLNLSERVQFYEKDYTQTGFADESFSVIWACESMCHAEHKADFYKEAFRLLKPGGRLVCADYFRSERPLTETGEKLLHDWLNGWSIKDIDTYAEHQANAAKSGFSIFEIEDITAFTKPSLKHLHTLASNLWKVGKFLKKIGLRNNINHGNHYASIKQFEALENSLWYYGLLSLKKASEPNKVK